MSRGSITRRGKNSFRIKYDIGRVTKQRRSRYVAVNGSNVMQKQNSPACSASRRVAQPSIPQSSRSPTSSSAWQDDHVAVNVSAKTGERYRQLICNQIVPHIGMVQLQKLRPHHLTHLYGTLGKTGLAALTIGHVHRLLHTALGHAGTWGLAQGNVAALVKPPKAHEREITILTDEQCGKLLSHVKSRTLYPILMLALASGARRGELLALRLRDSNAERGVICIERSLEQTKSGLCFKPRKQSTASASSVCPFSGCRTQSSHHEGSGKTAAARHGTRRPRRPAIPTLGWPVALAALADAKISASGRNPEDWRSDVA